MESLNSIGRPDSREDAVTKRRGVPSWRRQLARGLLAAVLPRVWFIVKGPRSDRSICLTFDDGPDPRYTPDLLDLLAEYRVKATFFLLGRQILQNPELARRIINDGHAVGHHTFSHTDFRAISNLELRCEIAGTEQLLKPLMSEMVHLIRPPRGKVTLWGLWTTWRLGLTTVLWNKDPKDYTADSVEHLQQKIFDCRIEPGDIFLFHDSNARTIAVLPELIHQARAAGLDFVTVNRWTGRANRK
jgi:peptidoglycan/xylan/chitin deacetylase (PgdA/CDA1 family)